MTRTTQGILADVLIIFLYSLRHYVHMSVIIYIYIYISFGPFLVTGVSFSLWIFRRRVCSCDPHRNVVPVSTKSDEEGCLSQPMRGQRRVSKKTYKLEGSTQTRRKAMSFHSTLQFWP